ncbi:uncharacterized protein LOC122297658 isoform X1 [Carya illinoinensis]|uniref:uncharacterized protein LOC122297658 isoform X1 n=1 Tax=Carya illinoinensis TaxID=32201 RepID=UPI001C72956B|nr:uncharacterized protein LOC122297658 isoform X1 [Carya illinoinensis]
MTKFKAHKLWVACVLLVLPMLVEKEDNRIDCQEYYCSNGGLLSSKDDYLLCFGDPQRIPSERGSTCAEVGRSNSGFIIFSKTCQIHSTYIAFPSLAFAAQVVCRPLLLLFLWNLRLHAYWQYCPCMFDANQKNIAQRVPTLLRHIWKNVLFLPLELY